MAENFKGSNSHIPFWDRKLKDAKPFAPLYNASIWQSNFRKFMASGLVAGQRGALPLPTTIKSAGAVIGFWMAFSYKNKFLADGKFRQHYENH